MLLNPKNLGLAGAIIWGLCIFITTLVSLGTGYAEEFLNVLASIYPGYKVSLLGSLIGLAYGLFDGFVDLFILAWIYNWLEKKKASE
ncbi:MAG: bacteriophage holin [Sedimentisphaerales bacterium]